MSIYVLVNTKEGTGIKEDLSKFFFDEGPYNEMFKEVKDIEAIIDTVTCDCNVVIEDEDCTFSVEVLRKDRTLEFKTKQGLGRQTFRLYDGDIVFSKMMFTNFMNQELLAYETVFEYAENLMRL